MHRSLFEVEVAVVQSENRDETSIIWLCNQWIPEGKLQQHWHCRLSEKERKMLYWYMQFRFRAAPQGGQVAICLGHRDSRVPPRKINSFFCTYNLRRCPQVWGAVIVKPRIRTSWTLWIKVTVWISTHHLPWVGITGWSSKSGLLFSLVLPLFACTNTERVLLIACYFIEFLKRNSGSCVKQDKHFSAKYHWLFGLGCGWGGLFRNIEWIFIINLSLVVPLSTAACSHWMW